MIAHLFAQQRTGQLGEKLKELLTSGEYHSLTIVIAFARYKGIFQLQEAIEAFLATGNRLTAIVGISGKVTSYEALELLLTIVAGNGKGEISVFHNNHRDAGIFHPKLYLFEGQKKVALLIGSNNLTEPGLFTNYEVMCALEFEAEGNELLSEVKEYIDDLLSNKELARALTKELLEQMLTSGYLEKEARSQSDEEVEINAARRLEGDSTPTDQSPLFGAVPLKRAPSLKSSGRRATTGAPGSNLPPAVPAEPAATQDTRRATAVSTLIMRPFPQRNSTQTQVPRDAEGFFGGRTVRSTHSNQVHTIREARSDGGVNTLKLEIPECRRLKIPIVVFEKQGDEITYTALEGSTGQGASLLAQLEAGLADGSTRRTRSDSTMWRID